MPSVKTIASAVTAALLALLPVRGEAFARSSGQSVRRAIGPLTIDAAIDDRCVGVVVASMLVGRSVGEQAVTPEVPIYRLNAVVRSDTARGSLRLRIVPAPRISSIDAEEVMIEGENVPFPFTGSLAGWLSSDTVVYAETVFHLTPDLSAVTVVRGTSKANVTITLMAGVLPIYSVSVNQASPVAQIADSLVLGDVWVAPGARFTLTIPTEQQQGMILMEALFRSRNIPPTTISAAIATWPW